MQDPVRPLESWSFWLGNLPHSLGQHSSQLTSVTIMECSGWPRSVAHRLFLGNLPRNSIGAQAWRGEELEQLAPMPAAFPAVREVAWDCCSEGQPSNPAFTSCIALPQQFSPFFHFINQLLKFCDTPKVLLYFLLTQQQQQKNWCNFDSFTLDGCCHFFTWQYEGKEVSAPA